MADDVLNTETVEVANKVQTGLDIMVNRYKSNGNEIHAEDELADIDVSKFTDLSEDDIKVVKSLRGKDLMFKALERSNDWKKYQRIGESRLTELNKIKETANQPDEETKALKEFLEDFRSDASGAIERHREKLNLPDVNFLKKQVESGGSVEDKVLQFQDTKLKKDIEKEFKLEDGTFVYDASEAYKPRTPSYKFRVESEKYENGLRNEFIQQEERDKNAIKSMLVERESQLKRLKETYFPVDNTYELEKDETKKAELKTVAETNSDTAFKTKLAELDAAWDEMKKGNFTSKGNPLTVENVFRGYFFDELVKQVVEKTEKEIHAQYNQKGLFLRDRQLPTDVTKMNGTSATEGTQTKKFMSPLQRSTQRYLQT